MYRKIILLLILCLMSYILYAQATLNNRVIKIGVESDIDYFTPFDSTNTVRNKILWNIFEPLVALRKNSTQIRPYLASSWKVSKDNRIWQITLRRGIKFHDGSLLTADDVIASVSLFQGFKGEVEKVDRLTVRFILPEPNSGFLSGLAQVKFAIAPEETIRLYKSLKRQGRLHEFIPVGSGPFKFSKWEKGKQIILESFTDYWQGTPWLRKVVYQVIPDNKVRISALERGEVDVVDVLFPSDLPRIYKKQNLTVKSIYGMNVCYISMNTTHKPLDNIKVRQALNLAVNKLQIARMFYYGGYGAPTNRVLSPAFWGFNTIPSPGRHQPALAKQMLKEAGYDSVSSLKLVCVPMARPYLPDPIGVAKEIKKELADIGVNVQITIPPDWTRFNSILSRGDFDLALTGWISECGDPDYILSSLLSSESLKEDVVKNYSRWKNTLFDAKLKAARRLPLSDVRGRIKLCNEAQQIFKKENPWIALFHTKIYVIHHRKIKGIILYPSSMLSYHKVTVAAKF